MKGGADGVKGDDAGGANGGTAGGGVNSGKPEVGDGGVAVAATEERSTDSGLGRDGAGASAVLGAGAGNEAGRAGGVAGAFGVGLLNGAGSQASGERGVARGRDWDSDRALDVPACGFPTFGFPIGGVFWPVGAGMEMTPPQTEQRARTPEGGTFAGSTLNIERQSGQLTFIRSLQPAGCREKPAAAPAA
jgi:hypothetical protein